MIASCITAEKRYGFRALPVFMLARDGELVADDGGKVTFEELGRYTDTDDALWELMYFEKAGP